MSHQDPQPKCHCGAEPADGWQDRAPGWPLCGLHVETVTDTVDVFVYGTLKQAYSNYRLVQDLCASAVAGTVSGFDLVDLGSFPGAVRGSDGAKVRGELLTLTEPEMALDRLDRLEGVPTLYTRDEVTVTLDDGTERTAFIYVLARNASRYATITKNEDGVADWHPSLRYRRW